MPVNKNTLGSRKDVVKSVCSYNRHVVYRKFEIVFQEMVLDGSYNRHVLITGVPISGIHCTKYYENGKYNYLER